MSTSRRTTDGKTETGGCPARQAGHGAPVTLAQKVRFASRKAKTRRTGALIDVVPDLNRRHETPGRYVWIRIKRPSHQIDVGAIRHIDCAGN